MRISGVLRLIPQAIYLFSKPAGLVAWIDTKKGLIVLFCLGQAVGDGNLSAGVRCYLNSAVLKFDNCSVNFRTTFLLTRDQKKSSKQKNQSN